MSCVLIGTSHIYKVVLQITDVTQFTLKLAQMHTKPYLGCNITMS